MHGTTGRKRGRPKAIPRPSVAYPDMGRREREHHRKHLAEIYAADPQWDIRIASLALEPYGITLVPTCADPYLLEIDGRGVVHVHQDYRDRRQISGSVWDGRKLIWRGWALRALDLVRPARARGEPNRPRSFSLRASGRIKEGRETARASTARALSRSPRQNWRCVGGRSAFRSP